MNNDEDDEFCHDFSSSSVESNLSWLVLAPATLTRILWCSPLPQAFSYLAERYKSRLNLDKISVEGVVTSSINPIKSISSKRVSVSSQQTDPKFVENHIPVARGSHDPFRINHASRTSSQIPYCYMDRLHKEEIVSSLAAPFYAVSAPILTLGQDAYWKYQPQHLVPFKS
ncbi:hypothetical protein VNO77_20276 [Canavalia gladiata]|uniref:Uncharacterized protein n=1 Tax=Canavalia gladiata TaxID=3824 RepID=A0AAN9LSW3_CANGL